MKETILSLSFAKYRIEIEDLPSWEDDSDCSVYTAKLCRDFMRHGVGEVHTKESLLPETLKPDIRDSEQAKPLDDEHGGPDIDYDNSDQNITYTELVVDIQYRAVSSRLTFTYRVTSLRNR